MASTTPFKEELELDLLRAEENELFQRAKEFEENQKQLAKIRAERECTIPPLEEIAIRERMKKHQAAASRGEVKNIVHDVRMSITLLILLIAATCALLWWGWTLMHGA